MPAFGTYFGDKSNDTGLAPVRGFGGPVPIYAHVYACFVMFGHVNSKCWNPILLTTCSWKIPKIFKCALRARRYAAGCYAALGLTTAYT